MTGFTLRQLEYFLAVVEEGSITAAAGRLHVSPGGVSQAVTELEAALKVRLTLRRPAKGVTVTSAGRWAAARARELLEGSRELGEIAQVMRGELTGPLRIGCFGPLSPWLLPALVTHFAERHPAVQVEIDEGPSDVLQRRLQEGTLDAVLLYARHAIGHCAIEEVAAARLQLVLPPGHRLTGQDEIPLAELRDEPAVLVSLEPARSLVDDLLRSAGFEARVRWRSSNVETIRSMVGHGLGYSVLMGRPYGDRTYDGLAVAYRRIADDLPHNAVAVAYPAGDTPNAKLRETIAFLRSTFGTGAHPVQ